MEKEKLLDILELHIKWKITDGKKGKRADLQGADLRGADLQGVKGIIIIQSQYPYQSYGYCYNNQLRITLGCFDRTIEEWEVDFWNNEKEFPKDSPQGKNRFMIYNFMKEWLLENIKLKENV